MGAPVTDEIAGALAAYFFGGAGPSHTKLTTTFLQCAVSRSNRVPKPRRPTHDMESAPLTLTGLVATPLQAKRQLPPLASHHWDRHRRVLRHQRSGARCPTGRFPVWASSK